MLNSKKRLNNQIPDYEHLFNGYKNTDKIVYKVLKSLYKENKKSFWITNLLYAVKNSSVYLSPIFLSAIIDIITKQKPGSLKYVYIYGAVLLFVIVQNIFSHLLFVNSKSKLLRSIGAGLRNTLVKKLQQISITYHNELQSGKLQSKFLRDMECIENLFEKIFESLIPGLLSLFITLLITSCKNLLITGIFIIIVPLTVFLKRLFNKNIKKTTNKLRTETENLSSDISEMIELVPITKAHGIENEEISKLKDGISKVRKTSYEVDMANAWFGSTTWVFGGVITTLCLILMGTLAFKGVITVGEVVLFHTYFNTLINNVQGLLNIYPEFTKGAESLKSVSEIMISDRIEDNRGKIAIRYLHGSVQFKNVSYKYPGSSECVIKNFNLDVNPGECIAFVGSSGSGKTTVMNMIIGFLRATSGVVAIDGKPIEMLNLPSYRHFLSVVPQNCILFSGTIRDNILYGTHDVPEEKLNEVIKQANIEEFINDLPLGLDTPVTEHGANLSGGQKQRISIARALIRDPKIIILDEATSALDNISEYHVQKAMNELIRGRTTFIVAHRLSTIRDADKIVVMEHGETVEFGTYDNLMEKHGKFYELKKLNEITGKGEN